MSTRVKHQLIEPKLNKNNIKISTSQTSNRDPTLWTIVKLLFLPLHFPQLFKGRKPLNHHLLIQKEERVKSNYTPNPQYTNNVRIKRRTNVGQERFHGKDERELTQHYMQKGIHATRFHVSTHFKSLRVCHTLANSEDRVKELYLID